MVMSQIFVALFTVIFLFLLNPITILVVLYFIFVYFVIFFLIKSKLTYLGNRRVALNEARYSSASESFAGIKTVKVIKIEKYFIDRFKKPSFEYAKIQALNNIMGKIPTYFIEMVTLGLISFLAGVWGVYTLQNEEFPLSSIATISIFAIAIVRCKPIAQIVFTSIAKIRFGISSVDKIASDLLHVGK